MNRENVRLTPDDKYRISVVIGDCFDLLNDYERNLIRKLSKKSHVTGSQLAWIERTYNNAIELARQIPAELPEPDIKKCNKCDADILWFKTFKAKNVAVDVSELAIKHHGAGIGFIRDRHLLHRCEGSNGS
jgi:hypothetical protein